MGDENSNAWFNAASSAILLSNASVVISASSSCRLHKLPHVVIISSLLPSITANPHSVFLLSSLYDPSVKIITSSINLKLIVDNFCAVNSGETLLVPSYTFLYWRE